MFRFRSNLENVVAIGIERSLSQFNDENAVGATGLSVQAGVCNLPLLLTWSIIYIYVTISKHISSQITSKCAILNVSHCSRPKRQLICVTFEELLREKINRGHFQARADPEASSARSVTSTIITAEFCLIPLLSSLGLAGFQNVHLATAYLSKTPETPPQQI